MIDSPPPSTLDDPTLYGFSVRADTAHSCTDGDRRWPVIDGIPYVRSGRDDLADAALTALDAGDRIEALALLLGDRDDWDPTTAPPLEVRRAIARDIESLTFRAAMEALGFGGVATYFAHRWSDPTFVAGLGLIAAHRPREARRSFEVACGAGHYLRELARVGVDAAGGDVVFAKLWLARQFVAPAARLICFDVATSWPIESGAYEFVHMHDALYFLPRKKHVADEMRRIARAGATIAVSHAHNAAVDNCSSGAPLDRAGYAALFPDAVFYDDRALAEAVVRGGLPNVGDGSPNTDAPTANADVRARPDADASADVTSSASVSSLESAPAFAFVCGPSARVPQRCVGDVTSPSLGASLVRNPLYVAQNIGANGRSGDLLSDGASSDGTARIVWPSERYEREYGPLRTYPLTTSAPATATMLDDPRIVTMARTRELVALPERW